MQLKKTKRPTMRNKDVRDAMFTATQTDHKMSLTPAQNKTTL